MTAVAQVALVLGMLAMLWEQAYRIRKLERLLRRQAAHSARLADEMRDEAERLADRERRGLATFAEHNHAEQWADLDDEDREEWMRQADDDRALFPLRPIGWKLEDGIVRLSGHFPSWSDWPIPAAAQDDDAVLGEMAPQRVPVPRVEDVVLGEIAAILDKRAGDPGIASQIAIDHIERAMAALRAPR